MCEWERHTQNHLYIYIYICMEQSPGAVKYIPPPPTPCQSLFIFFEIIAWFQDWKGWKSAFWRLPPILLPSRLLPEPSARLTWRRWHGPSPCPLFCPPTPPPHTKTLSDRHLLKSLIQSEGKKDPFFTPKDCRNGTIRCCSFPLLCLLDGGMSLEHFVNERRRSTEERGRTSTEILWFKKENFRWLYNKKKKMCGSFCHFLFLFDVVIGLCLMISISTVCSVSLYLFSFLCFFSHIVNSFISSGCSHHSKSIGKKTYRDTPRHPPTHPNSCPSPLLPQV